MALDQAYFDAIHIDVVKKKYYNAGKVEAVLEDIRRQALLMNRENELLAGQLNALHGQKAEISDTLLSAKSIAQQIIADAQSQADKILADARQQSRELNARTERECRDARRQAEDLRRALPQRLEELERELRVQLLALTDEVCGTLHGFSAEPAAAPEAEEAPEPEDEMTVEGEIPLEDVDAAPADLSDRVDAIAREIAEIDGE